VSAYFPYFHFSLFSFSFLFLKDGLSELRIITGAGHHSGADGPKVKPEVMKWLKKNSYSFHDDKENKSGGSLIVSL
jgi:hypothetical protein